MAEHYLKITNNTDTATIMDGVNQSACSRYQLQKGGWEPAIADVKENYLGARSPYTDVLEGMALNISGSSVPATYNNVQILKRLTENARRFWRGESTSPVVLEFSPEGGTVSSAASPLRALVKSGSVIFRRGFEDAGRVNLARGVELRLERRGLWIGASQQAVSAACYGGQAASAAFAASVLYPSPIDVQITNVVVGNSPCPYDYWPTYFVVAPHASALLFDSKGGLFPNGDGAFTYISETSRFSSRLVRYSPTTTCPVNWFPQELSSPCQGLYAVFASMRSSASVGVSYRIKFMFANPNTAEYQDFPNTYTTYELKSNAGSYFPLYHALGIVNINSSGLQPIFQVKPSSACVWLDIGPLCMVKIDENAQVLELHRNGPMTGPLAVTACVAQNPLTGIRPSASLGTEPTQWRSTLDCYQSGSVLHFAVLGTGGVDTSGCPNTWAFNNAGSQLSHTVTFTRRTGYLTPE